MPRERSPIVELLDSLLRACGELGVGWYVIGAQAALLYGSVRLTADVDVTILAGELPTDELARVLAKHDFELRIDDADFVQVTRVLPVVHRPTRVPADIVLGGPGLEELFLERAVLRDFGGVTVPVASPEDLLVMKVLSGRDQDTADVLAILRARHEELDLAQLRQTLALLEEALGQSDLVPAFEALLRRSRARRRR